MAITTRSRQYHSDGPNQGFVTIRTEEAIQPKWRVEIGPVAYASPVIGADGTIYIGTLKGDLVAVNPDGSLKWRRTLSATPNRHYAGAVTGSAAVGSDGNIYVVSTINENIRDHRNGSTQDKKVRHSSLFSVDPEGNIRWVYAFPEIVSAYGVGAYTSSSPKVWGEGVNLRIFVPALYVSGGLAVELLVINQAGALVHKVDVSTYPPSPIVATGPGLGDILSGIWDFISSPVDFDTSGIGLTLEEQVGWPEPTLAIVDYSQFANRPLILVEDNYKQVAAFRWQSPILVPLWAKVSNKVRFRTSPAVFANGLVVVGEESGLLSLYDVESGRELWKPWYNAKKPIMAPATSFGRQIYLIAGKKLVVLDYNSTPWKEAELGGKCLGAPLLSANFVYVSATDGLYTFSFDLKNHSKNGDFAGGVSSPTVSPDGTIYAMDLRENLWAFD
jgi:outer membrane protein assembly factor BamB